MFESLIEALERTGFQTILPTERPTQLRVVGRVPASTMPGWLELVTELLTQAEVSVSWSLDVSKQYFLREGSLVYAWRLIFQADKLQDCQEEIIELLRASAPRPRPQAEVTEQPLSVLGPRNTYNSATGKGASSAGTAPAILKRRA